VQHDVAVSDAQMPVLVYFDHLAMVNVGKHLPLDITHCRIMKHTWLSLRGACPLACHNTTTNGVEP
jgi:hypothetical protein